jgi:HSP20 family protein
MGMKKDNKNDWQEHLEKLDEHYHPDNFFPDGERGKKEMFTDFEMPSLFDSEIEEEGQLTIDIYQDNDNLYILTPIAGTEAKNIEITIEKDVLTIKGKRESKSEVEERDYLYKECYWGNFSRSVILPVPVVENRITAEENNHILKITLPKAEEAKKVKIVVRKSA